MRRISVICLAVVTILLAACSMNAGNCDSGRLASGVDNKASAISLQHKATSGVILTANPDKTTTVLGRYQDDIKFIIEELNHPKSMDFSGNTGGFNILNVPDELYVTADQFWDDHNKPFLDAAISREDDIIMATHLNNTTLYRSPDELTGYGREYYYLMSHGYEHVDGRMVLKGGRRHADPGQRQK